MKKPRKPGKPESYTPSAETSKPSLRARVEDELLEQLRTLTKAERKRIGEAMNAVMASWGQPHQHSGLGIRRLTKTIYECRLGLDECLAFLFIATPPELVFFFLGNHDEIRKLIRSAR